MGQPELQEKKEKISATGGYLSIYRKRYCFFLAICEVFRLTKRQKRGKIQVYYREMGDKYAGTSLC
jgi:hypothetical protein